MRQWLEAGYFKGDLPISQNPQGPFLSLSSLFPDVSVAFRAPAQDVEESGANSVEQDTAGPEVLGDVQPNGSGVVLNEQLNVDSLREHEVLEPEKKVKEDEPQTGNESSTQLKMILGLSTDTPAVEEVSKESEPAEPTKQIEPQKRSPGKVPAKKAELATETETKVEDPPSPEKTKQMCNINGDWRKKNETAAVTLDFHTCL